MPFVRLQARAYTAHEETLVSWPCDHHIEEIALSVAASGQE